MQVHTFGNKCFFYAVRFVTISRTYQSGLLDVKYKIFLLEETLPHQCISARGLYQGDFFCVWIIVHLSTLLSFCNRC